MSCLVGLDLDELYIEKRGRDEDLVKRSGILLFVIHAGIKSRPVQEKIGLVKLKQGECWCSCYANEFYM
jgi:hypothetical protein